MNKKILIIFLLLAFSMLFAEDLTLDIMFTNDLHGGIDRYPATYMNPSFPPMIGGGASAANYINFVRKNSNDIDHSNLLIDAGDFFSGHPIGSVSKGKSIIKYMNMIGYDCTTVGNHEFDIPQKDLIEAYDLAKFPILTSNVYDKKTGKLVDYAQPYIILEKMGLKIGIIGSTTSDTDKMADQDNIANVEFRDAKKYITKYVKKLRNEEKVDIVIVAGHMGLPYRPEEGYRKRYINKKEKEKKDKRNYWGYDAQQLVHEIEGIDLFIGGHMHKGFSEPWEDPVTHGLVVQGYAYGSNVGHLILKIDKETKTLSGYETPQLDKGLLVTLFEDEYIPVKEFSDSILAMQKIAEKGLDEVIGMAKVNLTRGGTGAQSRMGNLVADAIKSSVDADFAFLNLGGIRDEIPMGPITMREIFDVLPFENQITIMHISGKTLKKIIETRVAHGHHGLIVSGVKVVYNPKRENFDRVTTLKIGGEIWNPDKIYSVATSDFLMQGNASLEMLTTIEEEKLEHPEISIRESVNKYIKKNSPVSSEIDDRWERDEKSTKESYLK